MILKRKLCHICKEGNKNCIETDTRGEVYLEMFGVTCSKCGKLLVS